MASPLDVILPTCDARERFQLRVQAPASVVYQTAAHFDFQSVTLVRFIFWLRSRLLGSRPGPPAPPSQGFLTGARSLGWGVLREEPGRLFVAGAYCQPWLPDVVFHPLTMADFGPFTAPNQVKIAWTLEVDPLDDSHSTLGTETRAMATDAEARRRFRHYWRWARFGIYSIRWLLLPEIRRQAQASYRSMPPAPPPRGAPE